MDAGLAALLGVAVGSLASLGSAMVTGRAAARSQFAQWRQQHRRDAYANYLAAVYDRDVALDAVRDTLRGDRPDLREVDEKMERFDGQDRGVHRAAEFVILEGPQSVVERSTVRCMRLTTWPRSCGGWCVMPMRVTHPARPRTPSSPLSASTCCGCGRPRRQSDTRLLLSPSRRLDSDLPHAASLDTPSWLALDAPGLEADCQPNPGGSVKRASSSAWRRDHCLASARRSRSALVRSTT
jgi:hypothetical protein